MTEIEDGVVNDIIATLNMIGEILAVLEEAKPQGSRESIMRLKIARHDMIQALEFYVKGVYEDD
jgi:hypothetical protein